MTITFYLLWLDQTVFLQNSHLVAMWCARGADQLAMWEAPCDWLEVGKIPKPAFGHLKIHLHFYLIFYLSSIMYINKSYHPKWFPQSGYFLSYDTSIESLLQAFSYFSKHYEHLVTKFNITYQWDNVSCAPRKLSGSVPSPEDIFPLQKSNASFKRIPAHVDVHLLMDWVGLRLPRAWWVLTPWPRTLRKK